MNETEFFFLTTGLMSLFIGTGITILAFFEYNMVYVGIGLMVGALTLILFIAGIELLKKWSGAKI